MPLRAGRYEILRPIASGGMASVHLGRAVGAGGFEREVAIKTMHPHLAEQADFVAMFLDEARVSARIHHPNVVATLDVQQDDEGIFLVMEYVDGFALHAMLAAARAEARTPPFGLMLRIFLDALAGLHAAHELTDARGVSLEVIHRDVSPQNILVGVDGVTRLTDFGIARAQMRLAATLEGNLKGKLRYMAPEQLRGTTLDRRLDIHAAGAVLWEMLAGRALVSADDEGGCLMQIARPDKPSPRTENPDIPAEIAAACLGALYLEPEARYATAAVFAEAMEKAAAQAGIVLASSREVSVFVRALKDRDLATKTSVRGAGERTETGPSREPQTVATEMVATSVPRVEPRPRRTAVIVAAVVGVVGAVVLARALLTRAPTSEHAAMSAEATSAIPVVPEAEAPPASSVGETPEPPPTASAEPPPSAAPATTRLPSKPRASPAKPGGRFRPREL
ncbi:MAG: serine/threonine-protein kinase [Byssovorax sp.]